MVNQVKVVAQGTRSIRPAVLDGEFNSPDLIQTGPRSLAELTAPDKTITRVGSNTIFSYEKSGRNINLQRGSILFHSPKGKGGGVIRTKAASASVLGTTLIVSATVDGGFKCVVLEGKAQLQMPNGNYRIARAGQVVFVTGTGGGTPAPQNPTTQPTTEAPAPQQFGPTIDINLEQLVGGSKLVQNFENPLPSLPKILKSVQFQRQKMDEGALVPEPEQVAPVVGAPQPEAVQTIAPVQNSSVEPLIALADRFTTAIGTDLQITGTPFPSEHLFSERVNTVIPGLGQSSFQGLFARNIEIVSSVTSLDFTPFLSALSFDLVADGSLTISSPNLDLTSSSLTQAGTTFDPGPDFDLRLIGRTGVSIVDGATIQANRVGNLKIASGTSMSLNNVSVINNYRSVDLNTQNGLSVNGGSFQTPQQQGTSYGITFRSAGGDVNVNNASFFTANLTMNAARDLNINNISLSGASTVALSATTVNLQNMNFASGSIVDLRSSLGQLAPNPNTGAASVPGHVNFIQNVNYSGNPAQFHVLGPRNGSTAPGVYISTSN
ncbi:MAG: FecR domain-containing protein [Limisphaerales bacterium]